MKFFQREADSAIRTGAMLLGGLGLGAALMYVLDPERGKRRRGLVRDKAVSAARKAGERLDARSRDLRNRARGVASHLKAKTRPEEVSDAVVEERVRSEIGRAVSNPGAIEVRGFEGIVTLSGPVLASEVDDLLSAARGVRGVEEIENRLQVYESPEAVPALQGTDRWKTAESET
jgi:osmotically-inducible protein OsmY